MVDTDAGIEAEGMAVTSLEVDILKGFNRRGGGGWRSGEWGKPKGRGRMKTEEKGIKMYRAGYRICGPPFS